MSRFLTSIFASCFFVTSCHSSQKKADSRANEARWYAEPRKVSPLQLEYHEVLKDLPQGEEMRKRLCYQFDPLQAQNFDKVRRAFCSAPLPAIHSLKDLQNALGLAIPAGTPPGRAYNGVPGQTPAWVLSGHSTSLVTRFVSPISPRVILFTPAVDEKTANPDFVALGFVRGDQFVELSAMNPQSHKLQFFLVEFKQSCNLTHSCSLAHLQSAAVEENWTDVTIYEDIFLSNTVFDCTHCHQPDGPESPKILRMQEIHRPWTHFFRDDTQGQELIKEFQAFHGPDEGIGGIPASLISSSDPEKLALTIKAQGFGEQINSFPAAEVEEEVSQLQGPGPAWLSGWQRFVRGETIPYPAWSNNILDKEKLSNIKLRKDTATADPDTQDIWPDLREAIDDRLGPSMGTRAPKNASGAELLALACQRCHNGNLDPNLGKSLFKADIDKRKRSAFSALNAIKRVELLRTNPKDPLAMPPRLFMDLTSEEIEIIIDELKAGRDL